MHLNGDGHHRADHDDALRLLAGESLDQLAPMSWNRWERRVDRGILGQKATRDGHTVHQGQEVRSHFHGHIGLLNVQIPFAPWFFGPNNPTLGDPDRTNGEVFEFADRHGAYAAEQRRESCPSMHARPFAHSSPIWIAEIGMSGCRCPSGTQNHRPY